MDFPINITAKNSLLTPPCYALAVFPSDWCLCGLISLRLYSSYHKKPKNIYRKCYKINFTGSPFIACSLLCLWFLTELFPDDPWVNEKLSNYFSRRPLTLLFVGLLPPLLLLPLLKYLKFISRTGKLNHD